MKISVILAHPDPKSYNHAIAKSVVQELSDLKHEIYFHDLYAESFNPVMPSEELHSEIILPRDIDPYCREIANSDGIVVIHPNWWGQPPALLTGWVDRVFRPGIAYRFAEGDKGEGVPIGLLKARFALVINTSNTSTDREASEFGDPLQLIWKNCIFNLCGVKVFHREVFNIIVTSSKQQRDEWLQKSRLIIRQIVESNLQG